MADLTVTSTKVALIDPLKAEVYSAIAAEAITAGQAVCFDTNGKAALADANAAGKIQARGLALNSVAAGQAVDVLKRGRVYGFTLTSQAYSAPIFLSDTAGALADAAGTTQVPVGIVVPLADKDRTKALYVEFRWTANWA